MKCIKKIVKWTLLAVVAFVGFVIVINLFDEELDPEAKAYFNAPTIDIPEKENAAYYLMGLEAAENVGNTFVYGKEALQKGFKPPKDKIKIGLNYIFGPNAERCWHHQDTATYTKQCKDKHPMNMEAIKKALDKYAFLFARYDKLVEFKHLSFDVAGGGTGTNFVGMTMVSGVRNVYLAKQGKGDEAIQNWINEMNFMRSIANDPMNAFWLSILLVANSVNLGTLPVILEEHPDLAKKYYAEIRRAISPLTLKDWSVLATSPEDIYSFGSDLLNWQITTHSPHKETAATNFYYSYSEDIRNLVEEDPVPFLAEYESIREKYSFRDDGNFSSFFDQWQWNFFYNPLGKMAAITSLEAANQFVRGIKSQENRMRLLNLYVDFLAKEIPVDDVDNFLNNTPDELKDVFTNKPFKWDSKEQRAYFIDRVFEDGTPFTREVFFRR